MTLRTLLTLGRTSNLPTVWSNLLAGMVLSGAELTCRELALVASLLFVGSAFYEGGMFLNDAFDAEIDAKERPGRPIPSGQISRTTVFGLGYGLLGAGLLLLALTPALRRGAHEPFLPLLGGLGTCSAILIYNRWHKGHAWSPVVMGACRAGLYATAALTAAGTLPENLLLAGGALWLYVVGLTHVARFENGSAVDRTWVGAFVLAPLVVTLPRIVTTQNWLAALCAVATLAWTFRSLGVALRGGKGQIPRAVVTLIAGISLVDTLFIALEGATTAVLAALVCFLITLKWQRRIPGT